MRATLGSLPSLNPARLPSWSGIATHLPSFGQEHRQTAVGTGGVPRPWEVHGGITVEAWLIEHLFGHAGDSSWGQGGPPPLS
jgi:hypothetical protein